MALFMGQMVRGREIWAKLWKSMEEFGGLVEGLSFILLEEGGLLLLAFVTCLNLEARGFKLGGYLRGGGDKGSESDANCEHSESANEDILMFFFELDLATHVQVESEVIKLRESRGAFS